jgi:hypothetical protein
MPASARRQRKPVGQSASQMTGTISAYCGEAGAVNG